MLFVTLTFTANRQLPFLLLDKYLLETWKQSPYARRDTPAEIPPISKLAARTTTLHTAMTPTRNPRRRRAAKLKGSANYCKGPEGWGGRQQDWICDPEADANENGDGADDISRYAGWQEVGPNVQPRRGDKILACSCGGFFFFKQTHRVNEEFPVCTPGGIMEESPTLAMPFLVYLGLSSCGPFSIISCPMHYPLF